VEHATFEVLAAVLLKT